MNYQIPHRRTLEVAEAADSQKQQQFLYFGGPDVHRR